MQHCVQRILLGFFTFFPFILYAQDTTPQSDTSQLHMVTFKSTISKNYQGWSIQYREFEKKANDFVIPITLSFGNTEWKEGLLEEKGIREIGTYALGLGFDGYEYLGNGFYLNLGLGISPGLESIKDLAGKRNHRFLIGGRLQTGLLYVPFPEFGLVFGTNVIGQLSNSKVLNHSLAFSFEAGINF